MKKKKSLEGTIKRHADGFGFFIPDLAEEPDVYIPRHSMIGIMTNDHVLAEITPEPGGNRFRGEIKKVLKRGSPLVVGTYAKLNDKTGLIRDEGKGWGQDLRVKTEHSMQAKNGELVSVEITEYPKPGDEKNFWGKVKEVIGHSLDPLTDVKRVLLNNNIPHDFSPKTLNEAKTFSEQVSEKDMKGREDLRKLNLITIDGATARDFDDAIYVEKEGKGFRLIVAIADVSHYVRPGMAIDKDAYERGTSVYFPNFVVPMLPEVLSNGLCSLNPHVPRLALVADMKIDFEGVVQASRFYEAVIESKARVTYGEAQELIDGAEVTKLEHVKEEVLRANDLAKILMAKRFREGSLDLEIPEMQMVLDGSGNPVDLIRSERLFAHRLIEEMMLAANVAVAKFFKEKDIPAIYRIHESPNQDMIDILEKYLATFGGRVEIAGGKLQKKLTKALQEFEGKPESQVLNILTLRSMSQAKYSANNVGHFGLGFSDYTHFTSPIRRYPDLIVHRLLKSLCVPTGGYKKMNEDDLQTAGAMLSACEQRAVKSERQFQAIKKARFMEKHLGEEFDGMISSVTKFGVFVILRAFEVDGLIRVENLGREKFNFDEERLWLVAPKSGFKYAIGDALRVKVVAADSDSGQVDFELVREIPKLGLHSFSQAAAGRVPEKFDPEQALRRGLARFGKNAKVESTEKPKHPVRDKKAKSTGKGFFKKFRKSEKSKSSGSSAPTGKKSGGARKAKR